MRRRHRGGMLLPMALALGWLVLGASPAPAASEGSQDDGGTAALQRALHHEQLGVNRANSGAYQEALAEFEAAIGHAAGTAKSSPMRPHAQQLMGRLETFVGNVHTLTGDLPTGFKHWKKALKHDPTLEDARQNVVKTLTDQGKHSEALSHAKKAAKIRPQDSSAHVAVGDACKNVRDFNCAKASFHKALKLDNKNFAAYFSLGVAHRDLMEHADALTFFERAQTIDPGSVSVINALAVVRGDTCMWAQGLDDFSQPGPGNKLVQVALQTAKKGPSAIHPLLLAYHVDDPHLLKRVVASVSEAAARDTRVSLGLEAVSAGANAQDEGEKGGGRGGKEKGGVFHFKFDALPKVSLDPSLPQAKPTRLRVAYLTADIHDHPTALLLYGMLGRQRALGRVEAYLFSYGPDDGSVYRRDIAGECEHFVDMEGKPFADLAASVNRHGAHILIDMKQHTESSALNVLAMHPAPIQVVWLGFPGGVGGGLVSYLVGDRVVSPPEHASFFSETLAYMPSSVTYQVNNFVNDPFVGGQIALSSRGEKWRKASPAGSVKRGDAAGEALFQCLNHPRKIKPERFQAWMEILRGVPRSSLAVLSRHNSTGENLRREAHARGVDGSRVRIEGVLEKVLHLERFRRADLFLDTFPYGAHTTCTEALYAGLPVLTRPGQTFASRVAASLLTAVEMQGLLSVFTEQDYVKTAVAIARNTSRIASLRSTLQDNVRFSALFDQAQWVRAWDRLLISIWEIGEAKKKPRPVVVSGERLQ